MIFSPEQERALDAVHRWMKQDGTGIFRLFGYAGTGKTSLAKHFAEGVKGKVQYGAFTGKASMVMRKNGCTNAATLHSLIYSPDGEQEDPDSDGSSPRFVLNRNGKMKNVALLIVDECSMVDEDLGKDVMRFGVPVLVLGDPGQLPPVRGGGYFTGQRPDIMLEQIHRQAGDNPIIRIATAAREGTAIDHGDYGQVKVITRADVDQTMITESDQVLVGKNDTRRKFNNRIREIAGYKTALPQFGDRLVALQNEKERGILNGGLWSVVSAQQRKVRGKTSNMVSMVVQSLDFENKDPIKVKVHHGFFDDPEFKPNYKELKGTQQFDYGYALTVHKAQGSQWPNVVLFDESRAFREDSRRWLYTGITRAAETLTIVR